MEKYNYKLQGIIYYITKNIPFKKLIINICNFKLAILELL